MLREAAASFLGELGEGGIRGGQGGGDLGDRSRDIDLVPAPHGVLDVAAQPGEPPRAERAS